MSYRQEKLKTAMASAEDVAGGVGIDSIYLAGSLTSGLGSPTSDVDVYVLSNASDTKNGSARQIRVQNERVDIETYTLAWVDETLDKLHSWRSERQRLRHNALSEMELDFLIRMRDVEVVRPSPELERLRARLAKSEDRLRQMALSHWALATNGHLSDFKGSVADGDLDTAALVGQSLLLAAAKSVTTAAGDLYLGSKWVYQQLNRSLANVLPRDVFRCLQSGQWAPSASPDGIRDFLSFQQTLVAASQVLGWDGPNIEAWPFWGMGPGPYRRNPDYSTIHLTEGMLLNNELHRQLVVKPEVALVWALSYGREEEEIVDAAVGLSTYLADTGQQMTGDRARGLLAQLLRRGMVSKGLFR